MKSKISNSQSFTISKLQSLKISKFQNFKVSSLIISKFQLSNTRFQTFKQFGTRIPQHFQGSTFSDFQNIFCFKAYLVFLIFSIISIENKGDPRSNILSTIEIFPKYNK